MDNGFKAKDQEMHIAVFVPRGTWYMAGFWQAYMFVLPCVGFFPNSVS